MIEKSFLTKAYEFVKQGDYAKALEEYDKFCIFYKDISNIVSANKEYCLRRITEKQKTHIKDYYNQSDSIFDILYNILCIEQVYVISIKHQYIRRARFIREMNKYNIKVKVIYGEDGNLSEKSAYLAKIYKSRPYRNSLSTRHIDKIKIKKWKQELNSNVFAYLLSQQKVFEDAIQHGYKKILVFDDDVFFHTNAVEMLKRLSIAVSKNYKVISLGASEYTNTNIEEFSLYKIKNMDNIAYHPIPGNTCGSFAVIYDRSIFKEILENIKEYDGPYDNATLGSIYLNYKNDCFVARPAICIPNVSESNIRDNREQISHSEQMLWETKQYKNFIKKFNIGIILFSIPKGINFFTKKMSLDANINLFLLYNNEIKEIINNYSFVKLNINIKSCKEYEEEFLYDICKKHIKSYDIIFVWPEYRELTYEVINSTLCNAYILFNQNKKQAGKIDDVFYLLNY